MGQAPSQRQIREVRALIDRASARHRTGLFVAEGERLFAEIPVGDIDSVYVSEEYAASHKDAEYDYLLSDDAFRRMSDTKHPQGILAVVKQRRADLAALPDGDLFMILESIQDPGNLGTIIRTAEAAGAAAVIMNKGCADIYSPKTVRSTMGSLFRVPFLYTDSLDDAVGRIRRMGAAVYAADLSGKDLHDVRLSDRRAFIIGNEGSGITEETLRLADERISIPMQGQVESLNAAVAAAILMYHERGAGLAQSASDGR